MTSLAVPDRVILSLRPWQWLLLTLILAAGFSLRLVDIGKASFWGDEFLSAEVSAGHGYEHLDLPPERVLPPQPNAFEMDSARPWSATWDAMQRSTHPPLYFLLLRAWRTLGHFDDDASLRVLSAIFSVGCLAAVFDVVRVQRSTTDGLWAAAVLAVANVQVQFAQEARGYALLCLLMLLVCDALVRIERLGVSRPRLIGLIFASLGLLMTHYMAVIILVLIAIYAVLQLGSAARKQVLLSLLCASLLFLIIWGPSLEIQIQSMRSHLKWLVQPSPNHALSTFQSLLGWPITALVKPGWRAGSSTYGAAILFLLPLLMLRKHPSLRLWTLIFLGQLALVAGNDIVHQTVAMQYPRYTLPAATAAAVLVPLVMLELSSRPWLRQTAPAAIVLGCLAALPLSYDREKPNYRQLADYVQRYCESDSLIVFETHVPSGDSPLMLALGRYIQHGSQRVELINELEHPGTQPNIPLAGVVDIVSDSMSAGADVPGGQLLAASIFPGVGSCARVRLTSDPQAAAHAQFASP